VKKREICEKAGGHVDKCPGVVAKVAKWVTEISGRQKGKRG